MRQGICSNIVHRFTQISQIIAIHLCNTLRVLRDTIEADPKDKLIVEGHPVYDPRIGGGAICLYAQMVTTTALQRAKFAGSK
jgi:hypothetical protein